MAEECRKSLYVGTSNSLAPTSISSMCLLVLVIIYQSWKVVMAFQGTYMKMFWQLPDSKLRQNETESFSSKAPFVAILRLRSPSSGSSSSGNLILSLSKCRTIAWGEKVFLRGRDHQVMKQKNQDTVTVKLFITTILTNWCQIRRSGPF